MHRHHSCAPHTHRPRPLILGVGGGTASGKSTFAERVQQAFGDTYCIVVPCDSFYKSLSPAEHEQACKQNYDFDCPNAIATDELREAVTQLRQGKDVNIPVYSFASHSRIGTRTATARPVVIVEGILALTDPGLRRLFDVKIFVECDADLRLARRVSRDILERQRNVRNVVDQYLRFVKPAFDKYIEPTKKFADVIIPNTMEQINEIGVLLIVRHVRALLRQTGTECPQTPALTADACPPTEFVPDNEVPAARQELELPMT